ncbi:hypothetical protein Droror1_Dr00022709 [Drosera rotundifolia]
MVEPAVKGTRNVIEAATEARVRRVVFTSSIGAVYMDPNRGSDVVVDESCWSNLDFCKNTKVTQIDVKVFFESYCGEVCISHSWYPWLLHCSIFLCGSCKDANSTFSA